MSKIIRKLKIKAASKIYGFLNYWNFQQYVDLNNIHETARLDAGVRVNPGVKIGRYSYINGPNTMVLSGEIGAFCSISWGVTIGASEHPIYAVSTHPFWYNPSEWLGNPDDKQLWVTEAPPPKIGNDVWIGSNVVILRGAVIEDGAVIGAGSVVKGHIPAYAIAVGSPAKVVKYRFDESTREVIKNTNWWNWELDDILKSKHLFNNPKNFLDKISTVINKDVM